jgi:hypothetical protein
VDYRRGFGWGNRCYVHLRDGRYAQARAACHRGLDIAVENRVKGALYYNLGRIADEEGYPAEACWYYRKSIEVRPGNPSVIEKLGALGSTCPPWA